MWCHRAIGSEARLGRRKDDLHSLKKSSFISRTEYCIYDRHCRSFLDSITNYGQVVSSAPFNHICLYSSACVKIRYVLGLQTIWPTRATVHCGKHLVELAESDKMAHDTGDHMMYSNCSADFHIDLRDVSLSLSLVFQLWEHHECSRRRQREWSQRKANVGSVHDGWC